MKNKGKLIVLSGPSGVGKGTIVRRLLKDDENFALSVSATTRKPRCEDVEEVQGAMKVKEKRPDGTYVFIAPPNFDALKERLIGRGSESNEEIEARVSLAKDEYDMKDKYDFVVVNDDLDIAVNDIKNIIEGN